MQSIVTVTMNPALDKSTRVERVVPEHKLSCQPPRFDPGGGGINVARTIKKLQGDALALWLLGSSPGEILKDLLESEGVAHSPVNIDGMTRTSFTVLDESSGQQFRFGMPGPTVHADEWQKALDTIRALSPSPQYIVGSGSLPPGVPTDFYAQLADVAKVHGAHFVLDTRGEALRIAVDNGVYLFKPNARELSIFAEREITTEQEQEELVRSLIADGKSEVIVVSLGAAGVLLATHDMCMRIRAPSVKAVSKIGAGDSTVGGIVLTLSRGNTVVDAVRYGVATGAATVMSPGTQLCQLDDVESLYATISEAGE